MNYVYHADKETFLNRPERCVFVCVDILFDAGSHRVKKIIVHTNYPGHYDFGIYNRCNFKLLLEANGGDEDSDNDILPVSSVQVTPFTKWDDLQALVCEPDGGQTQPVVLNRASSGNGDGPNVFGSTMCYGYQDVIFEVMANNYIASVTVFDRQDPLSAINLPP